MYQLLFILLIAVFVALLFLNIFFRWKVFKVYKYLVQHRVQFGMSHFFSDEKMKKEVLAQYPQHEEQILKFVSLIALSVKMASALIAVILLIGYLLMKFR